MNAPARHGISCAKVEALGLTTQAGLRKALKRTDVIGFFAKLPPCLIGMEAYGSAHIGRASSIGLGTQLSSWHRSL